ncbi:MAG TPA: FecR family protein [bacterium]|nr:FecR family protein [bacterium]
MNDVPSVSRRVAMLAWGAILMLALGLTLPASPARAARAAHEIGELTVLRGQATLTRAGKAVTVKHRHALEDGDEVRTAEHSRAMLETGSGDSKLEAILTENTTLTVHDQKQKQESPLSLLFGAVRARIRHWTGQPFVVTNTATIGIKGTDFITYVKVQDASEFIGVTGKIECVSRSNPEYFINIGQRQWGKIEADKKPNAPIRVPDDVWAGAQKEFAFPGGKYKFS